MPWNDEPHELGAVDEGSTRLCDTPTLNPPLNEKPCVMFLVTEPERFHDRFWLWFLIT